MATGRHFNYFQSMNEKKLLLNPGTLGILLAAVLLAALTGCVGYVDGPRAGVYVAPPVVESSVFLAQDDYVYYPDYEVYYSANLHQYAYREGNAWVSRPAPRGVSVNVLLSSPSVRMNFHDSPANHHAVIARQYPKTPRRSNADQNQYNKQRDGR